MCQTSRPARPACGLASARGAVLNLAMLRTSIRTCDTTQLQRAKISDQPRGSRDSNRPGIRLSAGVSKFVRFCDLQKKPALGFHAPDIEDAGRHADQLGRARSSEVVKAKTRRVVRHGWLLRRSPEVPARR